MSVITDITAREIRDSRGRPTLEVEVSAGAYRGVFRVPSGASTGSAEAVELRDADGGMSRAIANVAEVIRPALVGRDVEAQSVLDETMLALDGTEHKSKLGGNAMVGVSVASAKAAAASGDMPLYAYVRSLAPDITPSRRAPQLYLNYINGGKHATSPLAFQEHIIVPQADTIAEALEIAQKVEASIAKTVEKNYGSAVLGTMGDEGGYVLPESDPMKPFALLREAADAAGYGEEKLRLATDIAASSFFADGRYAVGGKERTSQELMALLESIDKECGLLSIEDPFEERAIQDFAALHARIPAKIVGDDLTVTNKARLLEATSAKAIDAVIIKPNQVGTLTETLEAMRAARERGVECIVSHRSGETDDTFISDLAWAFGCWGIKAGALRKPERLVKYERLAAIEQEETV